MKGGSRFSPRYYVQAWQRRSKRLPASGFTIVESLIVLGVSGIIFISVVASISGRQRDTEFGQSVQALKTQLTQFINEVGSGYYPNGKDFTCTKTGPFELNAGASTVEQGASSNCIFIGKVLHFYSGNDGSTYYGYPIIGRQTDMNGNLIATLPGGPGYYPRVLAPTIADGPNDFAGETQTFKLQYGLTLSNMCYGTSCKLNGSPQTILNKTASVAFVLFGISPASGSQEVHLLPIDTNKASNISNDTQHEAGAINATLAESQTELAALLDIDGGVQMCFNSGGTKQSAYVTIGGTGRSLTVDAKVIEKLDCK